MHKSKIEKRLPEPIKEPEAEDTHVSPVIANTNVIGSELVVGLRVKDDDGNIGTVKEFKDLHNVLVEYDGGGSGFHCLVKGCVEYKNINGKVAAIDNYDPLYHFR